MSLAPHKFCAHCGQINVLHRIACGRCGQPFPDQMPTVKMPSPWQRHVLPSQPNFWDTSNIPGSLSNWNCHWFWKVLLIVGAVLIFMHFWNR